MLALHASSSLIPVFGRFFASIPAFTGGEAVRRKSFGRKIIASLASAILFLAMGCGSSERGPISERPSEALTPKEITTEVGASADSTGSGSSSSIGSTANRRILVEVRGFKTDEGQCRMAIYLGKKGFNQPDQAVGRLAAAIVVGDDQTLRVQWSIDPITIAMRTRSSIRMHWACRQSRMVSRIILRGDLDHRVMKKWQ